MERKLAKHYYCWIARQPLWLLAASLCFSAFAYCEDGLAVSPNRRYAVKWHQDAAKDYHLSLAVGSEQAHEIEMPEFEYRRENLGIANYDQRILKWYFNRFLCSEFYLTNENGIGGRRLAGLGVVDAKTKAMLLNHEFNGVGKDTTSARWCFVKFRAVSQRAGWDPFSDPDQLGLLFFEQNAMRPDEGECRVRWKELDGLVAAQPQFSKDGKRIGVLVTKRFQPFCYILSSTNLKTISAAPLKGMKLQRKYLTEVVGSKYSDVLQKTLQDDYGF